MDLAVRIGGGDDVVAPASAGTVFTPQQELVLRFLLTMRSGHTRSAYGTDLGVRVLRPGVNTAGPSRVALSPGWLTWCDLVGVDPVGEVVEEHVAAWARRMEAAKLAPATRARRLSSLSSWYTWLVRHEYRAANPVEYIRRPYVNPDVSKTPGLTKDEAIAVLSYADEAETPAAARNAALIYLLIFTGGRISEITGGNVGKLGIDRGHRVLWITGKGGDDYPLVIPPVAGDRLDRYLAGRPAPPPLPSVQGTEMAARTERPLLETETGKRLRDNAAWTIVRQLGRGAGLPAELVNKLCPHAGRHTFATLALDAGVTLVDLQDAMRHKDPRTTRRYDKARGRLDKSPGYKLASFLADGSEG